MDREDEILDVTPVFEYWFKKKSGNTNKQPAQIIASIVATGEKRFKNSETKLDISRRNEAIEVYEKMKEMKTMKEYTSLCSLVDKIITASKNLQKAKLRKYKYVKEMLDLVSKIKKHIQDIINIFATNADSATSTKEKQMYEQINKDLVDLKIFQIQLNKQKIGDEELPIKDNKDKFVIEVLAQLGYKNQMKFIGLNRTIKAKEREEQLRSEKASKMKFYTDWPSDLKKIWNKLLNTKGKELLYSDDRDDESSNGGEGVFIRFLRELCDKLSKEQGSQAESTLDKINNNFYSVSSKLDLDYLKKNIATKTFFGIGGEYGTITDLMFLVYQKHCDAKQDRGEYKLDQNLQRCLNKIFANLLEAIDEL